MPDARPDVRAAVMRSTWQALAALALGGTFWAILLLDADALAGPERTWYFIIDPLVGIAATFAVVALRRRWPLWVGLVAALAPVIAVSATGALLLALASVATRRRWREIAPVAIMAFVGLMFLGSVYPSSPSALPWWAQPAFMALIVAVVVTAGVAVGQRRALVAGLRDRAESLEREQAAREAAARAEERNRIARDMHDVVAHRISLVALHAGALELRPDLSTSERATAVQAIDMNARAALRELRDVLGVLHSPSTEAVPPPQPKTGDVRALVDEGVAAGMSISLQLGVDGEPPSLVSQTVHRVVREALTNARKHAPGAAVTVSIAGEPGEGVAVAITNSRAQAPDPALGGSGLGLVGLREAVESVGGKWVAEATDEQGFKVAAWIPWAP